MNVIAMLAPSRLAIGRRQPAAAAVSKRKTSSSSSATSSNGPANSVRKGRQATAVAVAAAASHGSSEHENGDDDEEKDEAYWAAAFEDVEGKVDTSSSSSSSVSSSLHKTAGKKRKHSSTSASATASSSSSLSLLPMLTHSATHYHSHFFHLQLKEMLSSLASSAPTPPPSLPAFLSSLSSFLLSLPPTPETTVDASAVFAFPSHIFSPSASATSVVSFAFHPPTAVTVLPSSSSSSSSAVTVCLQLPAASFSRLDFFDYRYHSKRAAYMQQLSRALSRHQQFALHHIDYSSSGGSSPLLPTIRLLSPVVVQLLPVLPQSFFPYHKLWPHRNNLRHKLNSAATPHYNAELMAEMRSGEWEERLRRWEDERKETADAITMLSVWATRRGLLQQEKQERTDAARLRTLQTQGKRGRKAVEAETRREAEAAGAADCWTLQLFRLCLHHLQLTAAVTDSTSSYHMFRLTLGLLSSPSLGVIVGRTAVSLSTAEKQLLAAHVAAFPVVVLDDAGWNAAYLVSRSQWNRLQHESAAAVRIMAEGGGGGSDVFSSLFLSTRLFHLQWDYHWYLPLPATLPAVVASLAASSSSAVVAAAALDLPPVSSYVRYLQSLLNFALTDRCRLLSLRPSPSSASHLLLSVIIDPAACTRVIDVGPDASDTAATAAFRGFWQEKSELRRFKDGRIVEAVLWQPQQGDAADSKKGVVEVMDRIVRWVLGRHGKMETEAMLCCGWQLADVLKLREVESWRPLHLSSPRLSPSASASSLVSAFSSLSAQLKALRGLPLSFTSIQAVHPSFRYTDPFPPQPSATAPSASSSVSWPVIPVIAQFESSASWPSSLYAIAQIKSAFLIQIASLLPASVSSVVSFSHLDLVTAAPSHYVFRLFLSHAKETALSFQHRLHAAVRAYCLLNQPAFTGLVTLAKRWLACHLFSPFFNDFAVELLCAAWWEEEKARTGRSAAAAGEEREESKAGERDAAAAAPAAVSNGMVLLASWLQWLSSFPFASSPVIVRLSPDTDASALEERLRAVHHKQQLQQQAQWLWLGCELTDDLTPSLVGGNVTQQVMSRLAAYAAASFRLLHSLLLHGETAGWLSVFKTDLSGYDALLHVRPEMLPVPQLQQSMQRLQQGQEGGQAGEAAGGRKRKGYKPPMDERKEEGAVSGECMLGVDVMRELLSALHLQLGSYLEFNADCYGGRVIAVRVRETVADEDDHPQRQPQWSVKHSGYKRVPGWGSERVELNVEEMLADIEMIGEGLLERVQLQGKLAEGSG